LPSEDILFALSAIYRDAPGKGNVKGVLFFTNQRIRFEIRDEVVTERKFLVFASKTETIRELVLDEVLGKLHASDDVEEGVVFKEQILRFSWANGVKCPINTAFELLDGENAKDWDGVVEMIRTGVLEQTRVQTAPPVPVYTFPTDCEGCGAPLPGTVKGQTISKCSYCKRDHLGVASLGAADRAIDGRSADVFRWRGSTRSKRPVRAAAGRREKSTAKEWGAPRRNRTSMWIAMTPLSRQIWGEQPRVRGRILPLPGRCPFLPCPFRTPSKRRLPRP
jgi:hypothetical protein